MAILRVFLGQKITAPVYVFGKMLKISLWNGSTAVGKWHDFVDVDRPHQQQTVIHRTAMAIGFYRTSRTHTHHEHQHNLIPKWLIQAIYWKAKLLSHCGYILFSSVKKKMTFGIYFSHERALATKTHAHTFRTMVSIGTPGKLQFKKKVCGQCLASATDACTWTTRADTHITLLPESSICTDKDICSPFFSPCLPPCFCIWIHSDAGKRIQ